MRHYSTWSRIVGQGVDSNEVEQIVGRFFAQNSKTAPDKRGSLQPAIDGKTLRGTIPLGETEGVHLLALYLPQQGVVASGDAMFDRRSLSATIVQAHGAFLWMVKRK